jgi:hydroxyacylglutathione hydrolase
MDYGCQAATHKEKTTMIFRPYYRFETGCASYLFGCGTLGLCAVVDAREEDIPAYVAFVRDRGMRITHAIDTHVHADHRSGGPALAREVGARYGLHESAEVALPFEPVRHGQVVELGNTLVEVIHTPGHTPESVCLLVTDLRRGRAPWFVLTGDTLFVGAVGRPDLPGDARASAATLHASLHEMLLALPGEIEIYPGHFSGSVCGVGLSGKPSSTIAFEERWNPTLSLPREAFIDAIANVPEKPAEMDRIISFNRGLSSPTATGIPRARARP